MQAMLSPLCYSKSQQHANTEAPGVTAPCWPASEPHTAHLVAGQQLVSHQVPAQGRPQQVAILCSRWAGFDCP